MSEPRAGLVRSSQQGRPRQESSILRGINVGQLRGLVADSHAIAPLALLAVSDQKRAGSGPGAPSPQHEPGAREEEEVISSERKASLKPRAFKPKQERVLAACDRHGSRESRHPARDVWVGACGSRTGCRQSRGGKRERGGRRKKKGNTGEPLPSPRCPFRFHRRAGARVSIFFLSVLGSHDDLPYCSSKPHAPMSRFLHWRLPWFRYFIQRSGGVERQLQIERTRKRLFASLYAKRLFVTTFDGCPRHAQLLPISSRPRETFANLSKGVWA